MKTIVSTSLALLLIAAQFSWAAHACPSDSYDQAALSAAADEVVQYDDVDLGGHTVIADHDVDECDFCNGTMAATAQFDDEPAPQFAATQSDVLMVMPLGMPDRLHTRPPIYPAI